MLTLILDQHAKSLPRKTLEGEIPLSLPVQTEEFRDPQREQWLPEDPPSPHQPGLNLESRAIDFGDRGESASIDELTIDYRLDMHFFLFGIRIFRAR